MYGEVTLKVIKGYRTVEACKSKRRLGCNLFDAFNTKLQTVLEAIKDTFEGEDIKTKYYHPGCRICLYFHVHRLAVEVGEFGHCDRNIECEEGREKMLKKILAVNLLGSILIEKMLVLIRSLIGYISTLLNQLKN